MGLDLSLYAVPATNDINVTESDNWVELAYGRKTWFIWDYFKNLDTTTMIKDDQTLTITKEAWEDFVGILDRNRERIFDYVIFKEEEKKVSFAEAQIQDMVFQEWYDDTFDTTPTLGYEWDACAMFQWLEANSEVQKYLNDPNYIVILEASY